MRLVIACSLFALSACKGPTVAPREAATDAVSVAADHAICPPAPDGVVLHLPALERSSTLRLDFNRRGGSTPQQLGARMIVDGTLTDEPWPERPPNVHALADGRFMLYDGYNDGIVMLWDPRSRALTRLGKGALVSVARQGYLIHTLDEQQRVTLWDIDPNRPGLRPLWSSSEPGQRIEIAGVLDGAPAFVIRDFRYHDQPLFREPVVRPPRLLCVRGPGASTELPLDLPDDREVASSDAIRGHRVLLHGRDMPTRGEAPFTVPVEILDLDRDLRHKLGDIDGAWTIATAVPHPYVVVRWLDHDERVYEHRTWGEDQGLRHVDPATEELR